MFQWTPLISSRFILLAQEEAHTRMDQHWIIFSSKPEQHNEYSIVPEGYPEFDEV
jgi:hypothetical protein